MHNCLYGKTMLISGASRGLGKRIAEKAWKNGAHLILTARSIDKLKDLQQQLLAQAKNKQTIHVFQLDLCDLSMTDDFLKKLSGFCYNGIDILINNAAIQGPIGPIWENDWMAWQKTIQVNLFSPIFLCRVVAENMIKKKYGKIVNLSGGGATAPRANFSAYAVAKAGLVRFAETFAIEVAKYNIDVNCVAPGVMNSALLATVVKAGPEKSGEKEYKIASEAFVNEKDVVERAADLCVYLASSESDGITGKLISAVWDPWKTLREHINDLKETDIYTLRRIVPKDRGKAWGDV